MARLTRPLLLALLCLLAPQAARAATLNLLAAASTTEAIVEAAALFEKTAGHRVRVTVAASSTLARQIEAGAPAHLYISANQAWMDYLAAKDLLAAGTRTNLLRNVLVMIAPAPAAPMRRLTGAEIEARLGGGRLAMGDPAHVPAGIYAREVLAKSRLWAGLARRAAFTNNVRGALVLVARGEAPLGMTYLTDALASAKVDIVATFDRPADAAILYPMAIPRAGDGPAARALHAFLLGPEARAVYAKYGFKTPE